MGDKRSRRRLNLPPVVDAFVSEESANRCSSRASFVASSVQRWRDVVDEGKRDGLKKFDDEELTALAKCFANDPPSYFNYFTGKSDIPKFVNAFRHRKAVLCPQFNASELERILLQRTSALEFGLLMEYLIGELCGRAIVVEDDYVDKVAACLSKKDIPTLRGLTSREDMHKFAQIVYAGAKKREEYDDGWYRQLETTLKNRMNGDQFASFVALLTRKLDGEVV